SAVTSQSGVPPQKRLSSAGGSGERERGIPGAKLAAAPEPQVVRILVKTPWQQEEFLVHRDMLVREFKELVARHFSAAPKHVVLVQAGRILKDHKALGHHGALLEADATVYVVVRSPWARPSRQASAGPPGGAPGQKPSQSSTSAGDGLRALTASLGLNTATFAEFQSRLMSHPDIMLRLLEDPSIQSKLSSPSLVKELLTNSRPVQQVIKSAPEISHVFSSPEGVRLVMELARNPAAVREILKSPPQALEPLPSLRTWPTRPGALGEHSSGESGPWKGAEAGQLASAAVRNLLRQIIRHLVQSTMGSPSRNAAAQGPSPVPEQVARGARRDTGRGRDAREQAGTPVPGPDVLPASWSPRERQALLDIQRRLQALATEEPPGFFPEPRELLPLGCVSGKGGLPAKPVQSRGLPTAHPAAPFPSLPLCKTSTSLSSLKGERPSLGRMLLMCHPGTSAFLTHSCACARA
uniref:Ubiquitin-like domain-containing protein n=1 Tax=Varanus komodoensis TaxID=61221 RepID=A0A8D2Q537_VARKO